MQLCNRYIPRSLNFSLAVVVAVVVAAVIAAVQVAELSALTEAHAVCSLAACSLARGPQQPWNAAL